MVKTRPFSTLWQVKVQNVDDNNKRNLLILSTQIRLKGDKIALCGRNPDHAIFHCSPGKFRNYSTLWQLYDVAQCYSETGCMSKWEKHYEINLIWELPLCTHIAVKSTHGKCKILHLLLAWSILLEIWNHLWETPGRKRVCECHLKYILLTCDNPLSITCYELMYYTVS